VTAICVTVLRWRLTGTAYFADFSGRINVVRAPLVATLAAVAAVATGCAPPTVDLDVTPSPIAVGARAIAAVTSGSCSDDGCSRGEVDITSLSLEPPGVFELVSEPSGGDVVFAAVAEGITTLTLVARTDHETKTFTHTLGALPIDSITITPRDGETPCELPALYSTGMSAELPIELRSAGTQLHGEGFTAIAADRGTVNAERSTANTLAIELPPTPGAVTLTSSSDASLAFAVEAFEPLSIDGVQLRATDPRIGPIVATDVLIDVLVGSRRVCGDGLTRTVFSETPTICRLADDDGSVTSVSGVGLRSVRVVGVKPGVCTLRLTLGTAGRTATTSLEVTM
jgi:hypothetical protein